MKIHFAFAALTLLCAPAFAKEVAGVNLPDSVTVDGKQLALNGAGIRKKFIIKVYVGGLYLDAPATTLDAILSGDHARSVHMHFVRNVEKEKIINAFKEGFEKNTKDKVAQLQPGLDKLATVISDVKEGGEIIVDYAPGKGTTVSMKGGPSVTIPGKDFGDALLRNWLGSEPADGGLKAAMLGGK